MAKTRSQTGERDIKKEEQEDRKSTILLNGVNTTTRNRITKSKPLQNRNRVLPAQQVKVEEDTDTKSLLKSTPTLPELKRVSQEQVENLIIYNNEDKISIKEASEKANMSRRSGRYFYKKYLQDPDHNIPIIHSRQIYTQDQKDGFIGYIVNDKMSISDASKKVKMNINTGRKYYYKYFNEQNPDIATPGHIATRRRFTQKEINVLISYIVDGKMSIRAASRKANICATSAIHHYRKYLRGNNKEFPVSKTNKRYTQKNTNEFIGYIVDDKMTIKEASQKANMNYFSGCKYYKRYLNEHNLAPLTRRHSQRKIKALIGYIVDDKMSITAASKKATIPYTTGYMLYHKYLKNQKHDVPTRRLSVLKNE